MARSPTYNGGFQESDRSPLIGTPAAAVRQLTGRRQGPEFFARLYREKNSTDRCLNAIAAPIAAIQARQLSEDSADLIVGVHTRENDTSDGGERLTRQELCFGARSNITNGGGHGLAHTTAIHFGTLAKPSQGHQRVNLGRP
jgi:hypothetical protein